MDPLGTLQTLGNVVKYLWEVSEKMKDNKKECQRLCEHTRHIVDIIETETRGALSPKLDGRLRELSSSLQGIALTTKDLSGRSFLNRAIWRNSISSRIQLAYSDIEQAMQEFKFVAAIDLNKMQHESEQARQQDSVIAQKNFDQILRNDQDILEQLQVQNQQMQEAMVSLYKYLATLPASSEAERKFLERGLHAMQRRSGRLRLIPDEFVITSLDVIIHHERKLGAGGFAEVFEADWRGTRVAVKVLEKGLPASAIQKEVNVWRRLRHPYILEFFGACPIADPPFMVCAYKEHGDAVEYLRQHPGTDRRQLLSQAAQGLDYLHANKVVHGDLKAKNILIDSRGNACLSDFGLSRVKAQTTTIRQTSHASQVGTIRWMAPEHMLTGVADKKTDIYSFAMTMYEVFTDTPPFASTPDSILFTVVYDREARPPRPADLDPGIQPLDDDIWNLITQCWAQDPADRLESSQLTTALAEICQRPLDKGKTSTDATTSFSLEPFSRDTGAQVVHNQALGQQPHAQEPSSLDRLFDGYNSPRPAPSPTPRISDPRSSIDSPSSNRPYAPEPARAIVQSSPIAALSSRLLKVFKRSAPKEPSQRLENLLADSDVLATAERPVASPATSSMNIPNSAVVSDAVSIKTRSSIETPLQARALYRYIASVEDPNEVSFAKGEIMEVKDNQGKWWLVTKSDGTSGIAPSNYLQII